jgi:hypothetical protein
MTDTNNNNNFTEQHSNIVAEAANKLEEALTFLSKHHPTKISEVMFKFPEFKGLIEQTSPCQLKDDTKQFVNSSTTSFATDFGKDPRSSSFTSVDAIVNNYEIVIEKKNNQLFLRRKDGMIMRPHNIAKKKNGEDNPTANLCVSVGGKTMLLAFVVFIITNNRFPERYNTEKRRTVLSSMISFKDRNPRNCFPENLEEIKENAKFHNNYETYESYSKAQATLFGNKQ